MMLLIFQIHGQNGISLDQVLQIARNKSFLSKSAKNTVDIAQQQFNVFQASLKPSIGLEGQIPGYFSSSSPITQPNGTIEFQRITQNNASLSLFATQEIAATGGRLFVQSDLQRFDDFTFNNSLYNGIPLRVGIVQPIFGFRSLKWQKEIAPQTLKESVRQYNVDIENTQVQTVILYSRILVANENFKIAQLNSEVNEKLIAIAEERLSLGKISEDEKLQLEIQLDNAKLNLRQSEYALEAAERNLWTFLGQDKGASISSYDLPEPFPEIDINLSEALRMSEANRPELVAFQRRLAEAKRDVAQQKADAGPQVNVFASYGLARGSEVLQEVYSSPFTEQQVSLTFSIPIVDWGRRKSNVKMAELALENEIDRVMQEKAELENAIRLKVQEFQMLQRAVADQKKIKELAEKRFEIANERYVLGAISITDWTLAQREKDQTKRDYILTLSTYWVSFYELRMLTGYDFTLNQKIEYN